MMESIGDIFKVAGRRRAIAVPDPSPGRTPTNVPTKTPMKQTKRLIGWTAMLKASPRFWIKSNFFPLETKKSFGQPYPKQNYEDDIEKNRCEQGRCNGDLDSLLAYYCQQKQHEWKCGDQIPRRVQHQWVREQCAASEKYLLGTIRVWEKTPFISTFLLLIEKAGS